MKLYVELIALLDKDWRALASCHGRADLFFGKSTEYEAKRICGGCPANVECREYALHSKQEYGVWGGMTPRQLRLERYRRNREGW